MLKYFRLIICGISFFILALIFTVLGFFRWRSVKNSDDYAPLFGKAMCFLLGVKLKVLNKRNFTKKTPCIFTSNHQSNIDAWIIVHSFPKRTITMGKKSILYIPIFGIFYWLCGHFLIDRKNTSGAKKAINSLVSYLKKDHLNLWIFPEGTRSKTGRVQRFKKGAFHLAIKAQLPIVPIAISSYSNLDFNKWKSGTIFMEVMEPISVKDLSIANVTELTDKCRDQIIEGAKRLNKKIMPSDG